MLVRVYQVVLGVILVWFCLAAFLGWKSPDVFGSSTGGRGGGFFGGGWVGGK
ncbi:MAG: hypothetical protein MPJ50_16785 [Pirellulales bacterium]|nr:hypothetical protein [Pirellulales bacterium]